MGVCTWLATLLDREMLVVRHGVPIEPDTMSIHKLPRKTGHQVADEVGGRYLLRYLLPHQVGLFRGVAALHIT